jgi:hypothetical protein
MKIITTFLALILLFSCRKKNENIETSALIGTWQEYETEAAFAGTTYRTTFNSDGTFTTSRHYFTDAIVPGDSCKSGHWDYMKGSYTVTGNTIRFLGNFCNVTYQTMTPNCYGQTAYEESFVSTLNGNNLVMGINSLNEYGKVKMTKQ